MRSAALAFSGLIALPLLPTEAAGLPTVQAGASITMYLFTFPALRPVQGDARGLTYKNAC
jgi:hypothetical protein